MKINQVHLRKIVELSFITFIFAITHRTRDNRSQFIHVGPADGLDFSTNKEEQDLTDCNAMQRARRNRGADRRGNLIIGLSDIFAMVRLLIEVTTDMGAARGSTMKLNTLDFAIFMQNARLCQHSKPNQQANPTINLHGR